MLGLANGSFHHFVTKTAIKKETALKSCSLFETRYYVLLIYSAKESYIFSGLELGDV